MTSIAIIGGTGPEGRGLGLRFAMAGHRVVLGSRDAGRAAEAAASVLQLAPGLPVTGIANADAVRDADWVVLSVPYNGLAPTVQALAPSLAGKLVISVVAPLSFDGGRPRAVFVPEGSAAQQVAALLPESQVASAFHHLSAQDLLDPEHPLECDVIVCADVPEAKQQVMDLAGRLKGLRPVDGGSLENSRYVEELTALLLHVNRRYKTRASVRLLGL